MNNTSSLKDIYILILQEASKKGVLVLLLILYVGFSTKMLVSLNEQTKLQYEETIDILRDVVNENSSQLKINQETNERIESILVKMEK